MRRFLAAFLAALTVCVLTGCGKKEPEVPVTPGAAMEEPAETPVETPEVPELSPEEIAEQERLAAEQARQQRIRNYMDTMTLAEKVGQLFFVRCPAANALEDISTYHLGGYLLFTRDYKDGENWLTKEQLLEKIQGYQAASALPLFIGSDEEGGVVTRASQNPNLFDRKFQSPQTVYKNGGLKGVISDTVAKNSGLKELGINVNYAPVCDVTADPNAFIYDRTFGQDVDTTSACIRAVVETMNSRDVGMVSVLKHFPGYGDNVDTHTGIAVDVRAYEEFINYDFLPFQAGIEAGAPFVLVSHNIVECMDAQLPASLSPEVHRILREVCGFEGIVITDDLVMDAVQAYAGDGAVAVMALQAGNDMICTTDYRTQIPAVIEAVENGTLDESVIDDACFRVLDCKDQYLNVPQFVNEQ